MTLTYPHKPAPCRLHLTFNLAFALRQQHLRLQFHAKKNSCFWHTGLVELAIWIFLFVLAGPHVLDCPAIGPSASHLSTQTGACSLLTLFLTTCVALLTTRCKALSRTGISKQAPVQMRVGTGWPIVHLLRCHHLRGVWPHERMHRTWAGMLAITSWLEGLSSPVSGRVDIQWLTHLPVRALSMNNKGQGDRHEKGSTLLVGVGGGSGYLSLSDR